MHSDGYCRLHGVCLTMAEQSNAPDLRARWLALAQASFNLAKEQRAETRLTAFVERSFKSIPADQSSRVPRFRAVVRATLGQ